ncbi:hypothetical protein HAX54_011005 [Datura stramonium]|uniref:Uncharacterized protein n=1 Tax=Datura stramonium TaxID=4076 RepID=A0ABS8TH57_DATST|nr:hypothetical protein [Datura stramonium]
MATAEVCKEAESKLNQSYGEMCWHFQVKGLSKQGWQNGAQWHGMGTKWYRQCGIESRILACGKCQCRIKKYKQHVDRYVRLGIVSSGYSVALVQRQGIWGQDICEIAHGCASTVI